MRTVGRRQPPPISFAASATQLAEGARFSDEIHRLPSGGDSFVPKGIYRFKTHAEANQHQMDCLAKGMASTARARPSQERSLMEQHGRPAWFEEGDNIRLADVFVVDIVLNACGETYDSLQGHAETIDLDGISVRTVSLQGLLPAKQATRDKDITDRIVPERALAVLNAHAENH